jgi:hypothetical protein
VLTDLSSVVPLRVECGINVYTVTVLVILSHREARIGRKIMESMWHIVSYDNENDLSSDRCAH